MFCRNCGREVLEQAAACLACGLAPTNGNRFCRTCGSSTHPEAIVCVKCGVATRQTRYSQAISANEGQFVFPSDPPKDPILICLLSVLLVGLGQIVLGQTAKGIMLLLGALFGGCVIGVLTMGLGLILVPIIWLVSGIDAYRIATKLKEGQPVHKWEFF